MKRLLRAFTLLFVVVFAAACNADKEEVAPVTFTGTWQLATYEPGLVGRVYSANELTYQQYYTLSADSTFRKFRSSGEEATGTFTRKYRDGKNYIALEYLDVKEQKGGFSIAASCSPNQTYLCLNPDGTLSDNNLACDVGNDIYKKIKEVK
ncbi:hypothetical protein [Pontibacter liquoris]|uniref:hypothetical protein n=1 Tax=Pontibacter liquoris TaxID=2905677 RepID=UPI001FA732AD|nr:hypothetical protein [Pontibacter liquoris]